MSTPVDPALTEILDLRRRADELERALDAEQQAALWLLSGESLGEARLRAVMECGWDAVVLGGPDQRLFHVSAAVERMLGYTAQEFRDQPLAELVHPEDGAACLGLREIVGDTPGVFHHRVLRLRHKDGGFRVVEVSARNLLDDPTTRATVLVFRDITAQRRMLDAIAADKAELERRVEERTAALADLYNRAPCGYYTLSPQGVFQSANDTFLGWVGYTREELIGRRRSLDLVAPADRERVLERFGRFLSEGSVTGFEVCFQRKDGSLLPAVINGVVVRDDAGGIVALRGTVFDDTERRAAEEEIRRANAELARASLAKNEFLASMSHELRTPLNGILGMTELLVEEVHGPLTEKQRTSLRRINDSGRHLLSLINDVLDLSKVEAGKLELELTPVSAAEVCRASMQIVHEAALRKGLSLSCEASDVGFSFLADERRLKQILVNLLGNAVKFTPQGGSVALSVGTIEGGAMVCFSVVDTGIGIAPAERARLFQAFVQLDSALSRDHAGTGLGLALVRRLCELHGGRVEVQSEPGKGSRFDVILPAPRGRAPGQPTTPPLGSTRTPYEPAPPGKSRVLVADDERTNADLLVEFLSARGYEVHVARDGREAVELAAALRPDVILMDVQMPGVDGLEAMRRIRDSGVPGLDTVPMVAVTALAMRGDRERCMTAGADAYMAKPVSLKRVAALLVELLASRRGGTTG